jgi:hypothetical protein
VLLTSSGQAGVLEARLHQLLPVCARLKAQLTVVRAYNDRELADMRAAFPAVYFAAAPAGSTVRELRAIGMAATDGDIVVIGDASDLTTDELIDRFSQGRRNEQ